MVREFITIGNTFSFIIPALDILRYVARKLGTLVQNPAVAECVSHTFLSKDASDLRLPDWGRGRDGGQANSEDPSIIAYFRKNLPLKS